MVRDSEHCTDCLRLGQLSCLRRIFTAILLFSNHAFATFSIRDECKERDRLACIHSEARKRRFEAPTLIGKLRIMSFATVAATPCPSRPPEGRPPPHRAGRSGRSCNYYRPPPASPARHALRPASLRLRPSLHRERR